MKIPRHRPGFTLIELLTVIAIIGILAAIIIPVTGRVRESARKAACVSNLRQIGTAVMLFAADNKNRLPVANDYGADPFGIKNGSTGWFGWAHYTRPYLAKVPDGNKSTLYCQKINDTIPTTDSFANYTGYGWNNFLGKVSNGVATIKTVNQIPAPSRTPMLWEDVQYDGAGYNNAHGGAPSLRFNGGGQYKFAFRHGNGANMLMAAGNVVPFQPRGDNKAPRWPELNWDF
jgi:prepilin-type N-terminal cleavage/methylation domain-containing protein